MKILMSGQLYIKREPFVIEINPEDVEYALEEEEYLFDEDEDDFSSDFDEDFPTGEFKDYRGCTSFWMSIINENGIDMVEIIPSFNNIKMINFTCEDGNLDISESSVYSNMIHFTNVEEMEDMFMPFTEFLAKSNFIGRKFKLNVIHPMFEVLNRENDRTVLYATDNIILVENYNSQIGHMFEIMRADSKEDIDCTLHDIDTTLDESYKNKALVYKKVFDYLSKNKRKGL